MLLTILAKKPFIPDLYSGGTHQLGLLPLHNCMLVLWQISAWHLEVLAKCMTDTITEPYGLLLTVQLHHQATYDASCVTEQAHADKQWEWDQLG